MGFRKPSEELGYMRYMLKETKIPGNFKFSADLLRSEIIPIQLQSKESKSKC